MRKLKQHELDLIADLRDATGVRYATHADEEVVTVSQERTRISARGKIAPKVWATLAGLNWCVLISTTFLAMINRSGLVYITMYFFAKLFIAVELGILVLSFIFALTARGAIRPEPRGGSRAGSG